jgi:hypothetical protein
VTTVMAEGCLAGNGCGLDKMPMCAQVRLFPGSKNEAVGVKGLWADCRPNRELDILGLGRHGRRSEARMCPGGA